MLNHLETVNIVHAPEYRSTALLLIAWFAAQLGLTQPDPAGAGYTFRRSDGKTVAFGLRSGAGRSLSLCELSDGANIIKIQRDQQGDFFRVEVRLVDGRIYHHLLPAGSNATTSLLLWELGGGSRHQIYRRALKVVETLV